MSDSDAVDAMVRHLVPGGVLIVEPWFTPEQWTVGRPALLTVDQPDLKIARMNVSGREGELAIIEFHYLLGTPNGVERFTERHEISLFTDDQYRAAFRHAGLDVDHDPEGLTGRGLYVATKPC